MRQVLEIYGGRAGDEEADGDLDLNRADYCIGEFYNSFLKVLSLQLFCDGCRSSVFVALLVGLLLCTIVTHGPCWGLHTERDMLRRFCTGRCVPILSLSLSLLNIQTEGRGTVSV